MASIEQKLKVKTSDFFYPKAENKGKFEQIKINYKKTNTKKQEMQIIKSITRKDIPIREENNSKKKLSQYFYKIMNFIIEEDEFGKFNYK
jgi:hypothetical protein